MEMRTRAVGAARRLSRSQLGARALSMLTLPYRLGDDRVNPVIAEHYSLQLGRGFADDDEAARHYFSSGWKSGVVPNPFVDVPAARFSLLAALRLRNAFARVTRQQYASATFGPPSRLLPGHVAAELLGQPGGWLAALMRRVREAPDDVPVLLGSSELTWSSYRRACLELAGAAASVHESRLLDVAFYESQLGGARFVSPYSAFDDYLANGELDGRTPHPFFEAEWYGVADRSQARRGRPVNQLLDFVARGELGQAGPHFWGQRYLDALGDTARPASLLAHFTQHASPGASTPAAEGVAPVARAAAERLARERTARYHLDLGRLEASGPVLSRHPRSAAPPESEGSCLVIVDERELTSDEDCMALTGVLEQSLTGLRVLVVEGDDSVRREVLDELVRASPAIDVVQRAAGEPMGAVARRFIESAEPEAWTVWAPGQHWDSGYLAAALGALREHAQAPAAAVVSQQTPQAWLRTDDAMWLDTLDGSGVVFRAGGGGTLLPAAGLDAGLAGDLLIGLASEASCAVVERPLVHVAGSAKEGGYRRRVAANAARSRHLLRFGSAEVEVGIAIPTYEDWELTRTAVQRVLETVGDREVAVVVVDNGSRRPVASILAACFASDDRVVVRRMPRNTDFALGSNLAAAEAAGRYTVFLNNDTAAQDGWLDPLLRTLEAGAAAAQPLLLYGDRTVQTAGTVFFGGLTMPSHLLAGVHPVDVGPAVDQYDFSALTAACLAVRFEDVVALGGFDPHYVNGMEDVDFCLRLREHSAAPLRVCTGSRVVHFESRTVGRGDHHNANRARFVVRWRDTLQRLDDRSVFDTGPVELLDTAWSRFEPSPLWTVRPVLRSRRGSARVDEPEPRLRWAIKTAATGDLAGDRWGDTFFAEALAEALGRLGQEVVIDRSTSHARDSASWDDVTLTLRGLVRFVPQPGAVNLLWVISHPDLVTRHELSSGFDRVYAAGANWAQQISRRWGVQVRTLLQATDSSRFHPGADLGADRRGVLFVGRTRGVPRVIVRDVIAAGGEPEVYGDDGWEQFIEPRFVKGAGIGNEDVPAAYGAAAIVLNDHWKDMADNGFFSNRLFDAAATGARIISDPVQGMEQLFGGQVQCYEDLERLRQLLDPRSPHWPDPAELHTLAGRVTAEHSFDARARVLLDEALTVRRERGGHA